LTKIHFLFSFNGEKLNAGTEEGKMFLKEKILIAFLLSPAYNEEEGLRQYFAQCFSFRVLCYQFYW
jgi:hypothetical protein